MSLTRWERATLRPVPLEQISLATVLLLVLVTLIVPLSTPCGAQGPLKGKAEWLERVAAKYKENRESLRTWRGEMRVTRWLKYPTETIFGERLIDYAYDRLTSTYRYRIRETQDVSVDGGTEKPRAPLKYTSVMRRDGAFYRLQYGLKNENGRHTVVVQRKAFWRPEFYNGAFLPHWFLTCEGADVDEMCLMYSQHVDDPDVDLSVTRDGDLVRVTRFELDPGAGLVYELSLAQGGNVTRVERITATDEYTARRTVSWIWQQVSDVWVPREITVHSQTSGDRVKEDQIKLTWTKSIVNEPLAEDEFSLVNLGLYRGDRVQDSRTNTTYMLEGKEFPLRPSEERTVAPRATRFPTILVIAGFAVVLVGVLVGMLRRSRKGGDTR